MSTLEYIVSKYKLDISQEKQTIEIPNTNRETLARLFYERGFSVGAEIGVERGIYSEILLRENPQLQLYSIDAWTAYDGFRDHVTQRECDKLYVEAKQRLAPYKSRNIIVKSFSIDAAKAFADESLDFVYIDANHEYQHVVNDLAEWQKKVKVGGIVAGHDYIIRKGNEYLMHVVYAVHGYCESYFIHPLFTLGRKHPKPGEIRDRPRSWFYVKHAPRPVKPHRG